MKHGKTELSRRQELAAFLRNEREAQNPAEICATPNPRRRVKGWLREEVAAAAGISSTWYMWLEQARDVKVSARALNGLSRAFNLDNVKRTYLFKLARPDLQPETAEKEDPALSPELELMLNALSPNPAYVFDKYWDVVASNRASDAIFGPFENSNIRTRNLATRTLLDPQLRNLLIKWEEIAVAVVGQFRAMTTTLYGEPHHQELVDLLMKESRLFRKYWQAGNLADIPNWHKSLRHPKAGTLHFTYTSMQLLGPNQDFFMTIYSPDDEPTRILLNQLLE